MKKSTTRKWIDRFNDDRALAHLQALGEQALPDLCQAYVALEWFESIRAQWLNRILAAVAADPVGVALSLLGQEMNAHIRLELAWIVRRFVRPGDRERLLQALAEATPPAAAGEEDSPWPDNASAVTLLVEGVGLAGQPDDMPVLGRLLDAAQEVLERLGKDAFSYSYYAEEYLPLAAAAAAALLGISERAGLRNDRERARWRKAAVTAALARDGHWNSAMSVPLPFLFAQAPGEAARVLSQAAKEAKQVDPLLSDLRQGLLVGREIGLQAAVEAEAGALPWLDRLAARADPKSYGPGCVLDIRSFLQPANALGEVMAELNSPALSPGYVAHSSEILRQALPFGEIAAIAVEGYFVAASGSQEGLTAAADLGKELRRLLQAAHLPLLQGWAWDAPPGQPAGVDTPQALHGTLCAVAHYCAQAGRAATAAEAQAVLAPLPALLSHALVRHAYYRGLLLAATESQAEPPVALPAMLEVVAGEQDPRLARAVLTMARHVLKRRAGPVYLALLKAPAVQADPEVAKPVVEALSGLAPAGAGEALLAFARKIHWGSERSDYGVDVAIVEAMGRLGVFGAIPTLLTMAGHSGLGSDAEVALLRLAARDPQALGQQDFRRVWERVMADGYAEYGPDLVGDQARAEIVRVLEQEPLEAPLLRYVCRFLWLGGKGNVPPRALPLLLARLPKAVASAKAHPGEAWEDRNWGGYNATDEETTAEWMSEAIKSTASASYSREGWRTLIGGLLRLELPALGNVELLGDSGPWAILGYGYDLRAELTAGLLRLNDAAIRQALEEPAPRAALEGVYQVLGGDKTSGG